MSFNRDNVVWQSSNGTWNRGFYTVAWVDYEGDPEWDAEYDYSTLEWVSTGHSTEQGALDSWDGANPGSHEHVEYDEEDAPHCDRLDKMAAACPDNNETRRKAMFSRDLRYNQFRRNW